jgi:hypothetical protein
MPRGRCYLRAVRAAIVGIACIALAACNDLRDYRGEWHGKRVGDADVVKVGIPEDLEATLSIETIDTHGLHGTLAIGKVVAETAFASIPGAEADKLANMTFNGGPIRVYLAFVPVTDGDGDAMVMVALYADDRIELRVLRGGSKPLYGIFEMNPT